MAEPDSHAAARSLKVTYTEVIQKSDSPEVNFGIIVLISNW